MIGFDKGAHFVQTESNVLFVTPYGSTDGRGVGGILVYSCIAVSN